MPEEKETGNVSRRAVIMSAAIVPVAAIRSAAAPGATDNAKAPALTPDQLKLVEAFADRLIPKDENGPGASECGAANYIDRQLADYLAPERASFVDGLTATNAYAMKSHGRNFVDLTPEMQDMVLTAIDSGTAEGFANSRAFFTRFRRLTLEGTFSDPYYGGNKNFAGWDMIGYPGPRLAVGPDEQKMNVTIKPVRMSVWGGVKDGH
ncbi:MAG TPA: gluconate 2-dehydrogenase subunit 3 family protein [Bryobacteraceae bacterium]|nr:gluconate 2-dehydrogenase subunit 3 family protein [Bryobacteraceae bacterium]